MHGNKHYDLAYMSMFSLVDLTTRLQLFCRFFPWLLNLYKSVSHQKCYESSKPFLIEYTQYWYKIILLLKNGGKT